MTMLRRWTAVWALAVAAGAASTACGGSVSGGSARSELENHGEARCDAACQTFAACEPQQDSSSCTCGCAGGTECPPCDCGSTPVSPVDRVQECTTGCQEDVADILKNQPDCDDEMLAVMQCMEGTTCTDSKACLPPWDALEACRETYDRAPDVGIVAPDVGLGSVTCQAGFASGSPGGSGPPAPGSVACDHGWDSCSDGQRYEITCVVQPDGTMACQCLVSGQPAGTFVTTQCSTSTVDANAACGWDLK